MEISQNFVAFSEHMNFTAKSGKHTFLSVKWLFVTQLDNFICWATSTPWKTFWPYCVIAFLETATCADNALPAFVPDDPTSPSRTLYIDKDRFRKVSLKAKLPIKLYIVNLVSTLFLDKSNKLEKGSTWNKTEKHLI